MYFWKYSFSLLACSLLSLHAASPMKDYIVKEDVYQIVAESPTVSVLKWTSEMLPVTKIKSMVNYCSSIGGESIMVEKSAKKNLFGDIYYEMSCKAPNAQGFELSKKGNLYFLTHESPQDLGYAMKAYAADEKLGEKRSVKELYSSMLDFGVNFYDFYGYCTAKGGEYLISNGSTGNKAVKANDYIVKGVGIRDLSVKEAGKHWCADTKNPADAFTLTLSPHPYNGVMRFQVTKEGVNKNEIVMDDSINPTYMMSRSESAVVMQNTPQPTNQVMMSKQPTSSENDLVAKVFKIKDTVLSRQGGNILEGMYLGENEQGCQLAAITKSSGRQLPHNFLTLSANAPEWIMNFKQCQGKPTEYLGESFEKKFPGNVEVEMEFRRVLDMCKIRGMGMGNYLGYNMDCKRLGDTSKPVYEVTMTKKERLVMRSYEQ